MLTTVLGRMSNDEQRFKLLQTLRTKLSGYNLHGSDLRIILDLFHSRTIRFEIFQFLLTAISNPIDMDTCLALFAQLNDGNDDERQQFLIFEQMFDKLNVCSRDDIERVIGTFRTEIMKQKVEKLIRFNRPDLFVDKHENASDRDSLPILQRTRHPEFTMAKQILSPSKSVAMDEDLQYFSAATLNSFDNEHRDHRRQSCLEMIVPSLSSNQDQSEWCTGESVQLKQSSLPSISANSSDSSLSSSSDENIPLRTRSFMAAIKNTFGRLKESIS